MNRQKHYLLSIVTGSAILLSPLLGSAQALASSGAQPLKATTASVSARQLSNAAEQIDDETEGYGMGMMSVIVDSMDLHFQRVKEYMLNQEMSAAGTELRRAAAFLHLQAGLASGQEKEALTLYAREMGTMAQDVEAGIITSADDLAHTFADVQNELATVYQQRALNAWDTVEIDSRMAGQDLGAAIVNLEHGAKWVDHTPDAALVEQTRQVSDYLMAGTWSPQSTLAPIIGLDAELERLNSSIKSVLSEEDLLLGEETTGFDFIHPQIKPREAEMSLQELYALDEFESGYVYPLADEADLYFQIAYDHVVNNDWNSAAAAIRAGAAFLKLQEGRTVPEKGLLHQMVVELYSVAKMVGEGRFSSTDDLAILFARADYALARHHQLKAARSWGEAETQVRLAGQDLGGALSYFDHSNMWSGSSVDSPVLNNARLLATDLRSAAAFEPNEAGNIIKAVARDIQVHKLALANEEEMQ